MSRIRHMTGNISVLLCESPVFRCATHPAQPPPTGKSLRVLLMAVSYSPQLLDIVKQ